jgi:hypothetical protein
MPKERRGLSQWKQSQKASGLIGRKLPRTEYESARLLGNFDEGDRSSGEELKTRSETSADKLYADDR